MHPSLQRAIDIIEIEHNTAEYSQTFAAVRDVISVFGELNLANRLLAEIPRAVPERLVTDLFNLLAWQTNDNGAAMMREVETWLRDSQVDDCHGLGGIPISRRPGDVSGAVHARSGYPGSGSEVPNTYHIAKGERTSLNLAQEERGTTDLLMDSVR